MWEQYAEKFDEWTRKKKVQEKIRGIIGHSEASTNLTSSFQELDVNPSSQAIPQSEISYEPSRTLESCQEELDEDRIFRAQKFPQEIRAFVYRDPDYAKGLNGVNKLLPPSPHRMQVLEKKKAKNVSITSGQTVVLGTQSFKLAFLLYFHCVSPPLIECREIEKGLRDIWNVIAVREGDCCGAWDRGVAYKIQRRMSEERSKMLGKAFGCLGQLFDLRENNAAYYLEGLRFAVAPKFYQVSPKYHRGTGLIEIRRRITESSYSQISPSPRSFTWSPGTG